MEALQDAVARGDWTGALARCDELGIDPTSTYALEVRWLASDGPDPALLEQISDSHFVASAVLDGPVETVDLQRRLLECALAATGQEASSVREVRRELLKMSDRLRTYEELYQGAAAQGTPEHEVGDDGGWAADLDLEEEDEQPRPTTSSARTTPALSSFLRDDTVSIARDFAASGDTSALRVFLLRHGADLSSSDRLSVAESLPMHTEALEYLELVPSPKAPAQVTPWRGRPDWSELPPSPGPAGPALDEAELSVVFRTRIEAIELTTGMVELALSFVQHGAARGIADLESLGEELSLLSTLTYDRPPQSADADTDDDWTLTRWRAASRAELVRAYLAHSSETTVADDVQRLLRPLLYVFEARDERAGLVTSQVSNHLLYGYILSSPLAIVRALVAASKPTSPASKRIIKDDVDLARLAISCLYGSRNVEEWPVMSSMFECLPAFASDHASDKAPRTFPDAILGRDASPAQLFEALAGSTATELGHILDALDIHLDSGETLARWGAPQPLIWLLTSADDAAEQKQWCLRLIRKGGAQAESEDEWVALLEDVVRLAAPGAAFSLLKKDQVTRMFFEALLSAGSFSLAKSLLNPSTGTRPLEPMDVQDLVLTASRELYDNAESGNLHTGTMKLALECLSVAPPTEQIRKGRDFIEATSRLCSFNLPDQPTPIEIRLADDKLALVRRVLEQHSDAFRHPDVIIDLVAKLTVETSPLNDIRTLGMIVDTCLVRHDYKLAADSCDRMVSTLPRAKQASVATEVVWRCCAAVGATDSYGDTDRRMRLIGRAMLLAPEGEVIRTLLPAWRSLESLPRDPASPARQAADAPARNAEAAARAAMSFGKAATAYLRPLNPHDEKPRSPSPASAFDRLGDHGRFGVREAVGKRFTQGVAFLLGAEPSDLDPVDV